MTSRNILSMNSKQIQLKIELKFTTRFTLKLKMSDKIGKMTCTFMKRFRLQPTKPIIRCNQWITRCNDIISKEHLTWINTDWHFPKIYSIYQRHSSQDFNSLRWKLDPRCLVGQETSFQRYFNEMIPHKSEMRWN